MDGKNVYKNYKVSRFETEQNASNIITFDSVQKWSGTTSKGRFERVICIEFPAHHFRWDMKLNFTENNHIGSESMSLIDSAVKARPRI